MTVSNIIHFEGVLDVEHMAFVVERYIQIRKGVQVQINLGRSRGGLLWQAYYMNDIQLLSEAYEIAAYWFKEQGY